MPPARGGRYARRQTNYSKIWGGLELWLCSVSAKERGLLMTVHDPKRAAVLRGLQAEECSGRGGSVQVYHRLSLARACTDGDGLPGTAAGHSGGAEGDDGAAPGTGGFEGVYAGQEEARRRHHVGVDTSREIDEASARVGMDVRLCDGATGAYDTIFVPIHRLQTREETASLLRTLVTCAGPNVPFSIRDDAQADEAVSSPDTLLFNDGKWFTSSSYASCVLLSSLLREFKSSKGGKRASSSRASKQRDAVKACPLADLMNKSPLIGVGGLRADPSQVMEFEYPMIIAIFKSSSTPSTSAERDRDGGAGMSRETPIELLSRKGPSEYGPSASSWSRTLGMYLPSPAWLPGVTTEVPFLAVLDLLFSTPLAHAQFHSRSLPSPFGSLSQHSRTRSDSLSSALAALSEPPPPLAIDSSTPAEGKITLSIPTPTMRESPRPWASPQACTPPGAWLPHSHAAGAATEPPSPGMSDWGGMSSGPGIEGYLKGARGFGMGMDDEEEDIVDKHDDEWFQLRRHTDAQRIAERQGVTYAVSRAFPESPGVLKERDQQQAKKGVTAATGRLEGSASNTSGGVGEAGGREAAGGAGAAAGGAGSGSRAGGHRPDSTDLGAESRPALPYYKTVDEGDEAEGNVKQVETQKIIGNVDGPLKQYSISSLLEMRARASTSPQLSEIPGEVSLAELSAGPGGAGYLSQQPQAQPSAWRGGTTSLNAVLSADAGGGGIALPPQEAPKGVDKGAAGGAVMGASSGGGAPTSAKTKKGKQKLEKLEQERNEAFAALEQRYLEQHASMAEPLYNPLRPTHDPVHHLSEGRRRVASDLGRRLREFCIEAKPSAREVLLRDKVLERVADVVSVILEGSSVDLYGSYATGVSLPHSDVDLVVSDPFPEEALEGRRKLLVEALEQEAWCEDVRLIEAATVPVIKFVAREGSTIGSVESEEDGELSVEVDVTFSPCAASKEGWGGYTALNSRDFVRFEMDRFPLIRTLALGLKHLLFMHGLNDSGGYSGGLSSHCLCLLLIFYFQNLEEGQLKQEEEALGGPAFFEGEGGGNGERGVWGSQEAIKDVVCGEAMLRILQWFATFPFNHLGVQVFHPPLPDPDSGDDGEANAVLPPSWRIEGFVAHTWHASQLMAKCYVTSCPQPERDPEMFDQLLQRAHYAAQNPEACDLEGDGSLLYVIDSFNADVNVASASFMWWRARMELQGSFDRLVALYTRLDEGEDWVDMVDDPFTTFVGQPQGHHHVASSRASPVDSS